jgi:hypothetical protein
VRRVLAATVANVFNSRAAGNAQRVMPFNAIIVTVNYLKSI